MHYWGEDEFDWESMWKAVNYCCKKFHRWGRIRCYGKEKFGTFRDHTDFWDGTLYHLIWPSRVYIRGLIGNFLYYTFDEYFFQYFTRYTGIQWLFVKYQMWLYNYTIQKVCKQYPHLIDELVSDLDHYQLIRPGRFGNIDGTIIHKKYWRSVVPKA